MYIKVYGRSTPTCSFCENLKKLLESKKLSYDYLDISDEEVYSEFCKYRLKTVPAVFIDGEYVGGFTETKELLV